jgi:hypothetical protein
VPVASPRIRADPSKAPRAGCPPVSVHLRRAAPGRRCTRLRRRPCPGTS